MTTQLTIYNNALVEFLGARQLASLSDNVESRRVLDVLWTDGEHLKQCLEEAYWKHAMREVALDASLVTTPPTGWTYAFDQPSDMVKLYSFTTDERFDTPVKDYLDSRNHWYCEYNKLYLRYVSNDAAYGGNYALWPTSFRRYVEGSLALRAIKRITDATTDEEALEKKVAKIKAVAKANDAIKEGPKEPLPTGWQRARSYPEGYRRRYHPYR